MAQGETVARVIQKNEQQILEQWISLQLSSAARRTDLIKEKELREQSREFLQSFAAAAQQDGQNIETPVWKGVKDLLAGLSRSRANQGFSPSETAMFVFSLKQPLFELLRREIKDGEQLANEICLLTVLIDKLGLYTTESYQQVRESVIARQQEELLELSTPVVELWD